MRILLLLLLSWSLNQPAYSQTTPPTQKEMQAQMNEALNDARQNVAEQKKQIADAKLNKEDPESIIEMEKQLRVMEQMVTMLEKNSSLGNKMPEKLLPPKTIEPKYVSPFVPIPLKQPVAAPTKEQAKDQLLWYTGRRIDANTLITVSGMVVRYDRANNRVIVQPDRRVDSPHYYYGLVNMLAQTPQMKNEFVVRINGIKNSFFMYPEIQKAYDEFNFFRDRYYDIAKNTKKLPTYQSIGNPPEVLHHQLIASMATLPSPRDIVLPPERPNTLCSCDPQEQEHYKEKLRLWLIRFYHEETGLLNLIQEIYLSLTSGNVQGNALPPSVPNLHTDIIRAFNLVIERSTQKLEELNNRYQPSNVLIEDGLVMATKSFHLQLFRELGSTGAQSTRALRSNADAIIAQIRDLLLNNTVFEKYIQEQKAALNFNALFDFSLFTSHELNKKILKVSNQVEENLAAWAEMLNKFNRFALSLKLDFEYEQIDPATEEPFLKADGKLESDYIIVSLGRVGDECGWHLFATDPNHSGTNVNEEEFIIPLRVIEGKKIIQKKTMFYSGPGKMNMVYPTFKINFCPNGTNDKVMMDVMRYNDADLQRHERDDAGKVYTVDMQFYASKMILVIKKAEINLADLNRISLDMMNIQGITLRPPSTGNQTLDKIMMNYIMNQKKRELQSSLEPTFHSGNTVITFDAKNGSSVLISKTHSIVDPADQDYEFGVRLTKGLITIKVTHSPL